MNEVNCAHCGKAMQPGVNPLAPYKLYNEPELYCSKVCIDAVQATRKKPKGKGTRVEVPAEDFGDAGIVRHQCNREGCGKPITLGWKGENGEYCSNTCLKLAESEPKEQDEMNEMNEANESTSPITAGKKSKKTPAKKAAKGKAPAKAKKATSNGEGRATHWKRTAVIHHTETFKECRSLKGNGTASKRVRAIKDGMTVQDYLEALKKAKLPAGLGNLIAAEKAGYIKVK